MEKSETCPRHSWHRMEDEAAGWGQLYLVKGEDCFACVRQAGKARTQSHRHGDMNLDFRLKS